MPQDRLAEDVPEQQLRQACAELNRCLRAGQPGNAETWLAAYPLLAAHPDLALELIFTEFITRRELGQQPTPGEWYRRFPHWQERLQRLFQVDDLIRPSGPGEAGTSLTIPPASVTDSAGAAPAGGASAPYEILTELGRGGMGVVYKARQVSLNRTVAIKKILAGVYASAEELARFRREAEAAACLHHPNIVQIHEVGDEDGRPYLVLEYVDGGSLEARAAGKPQPAREAAQLVETLARAMHYAHQQGIIHRDLKPANILLQRDEGRGARDEGIGARDQDPFSLAPRPSPLVPIPKVTDFGLAKRLQAAAGPTQTGAIVGTPSYMAPEQAAGQTRAIGPATDVYGLGAILYELLTGRPPFQGETAMDTLLQVRGTEPVPPSRLRPKLPRDLETICLKCLHKEPDSRYASALALADDLRCFLAGEPILARPAGIVERTTKWGKRQPALAGLLATLALAATAAVTGGVWFTAELRKERDNARAEKDDADRQRQAAAAARDRAEEQKHRAERSYQLARTALNESVDHLENDPRLKSGPLEDLLKVVKQSQLKFFQRFVQEQGEEPTFQCERGLAFWKLHDLLYDMGSKTEAIGSIDQAVAVFVDLVRDQPGVDQYRFNLACIHRHRGMTRQSLGRRDAAEQDFKSSRDLLLDLIRDYPHTPAASQRELGRCYNNMAIFYEMNGLFPKAERAYQDAIQTHEVLVSTNPGVPDYQLSLASANHNLSILLRKEFRFADAERIQAQALDLRKGLVRDHPDVENYRFHLATSYQTTAGSHWQARRFPQAEADFQEAIHLYRTLLSAHPKKTEYAVVIASTQMQWGHLKMYTNGPRNALELYALAITALEAIRAEDPSYVRTRRLLVSAYKDQAKALTALHHRVEALQAWDKAVECDRGERSSELRLGRARTVALLQDPAFAVSEANACVADTKANMNLLFEAACVYAIAAAAATADVQLAEEYSTQAIALLRRAIARGFKEVKYMEENPDLTALRGRKEFQQIVVELKEQEKR